MSSLSQSAPFGWRAFLPCFSLASGRAPALSMRLLAPVFWQEKLHAFLRPGKYIRVLYQCFTPLWGQKNISECFIRVSRLLWGQKNIYECLFHVSCFYEARKIYTSALSMFHGYRRLANWNSARVLWYQWLSDAWINGARYSLCGSPHKECLCLDINCF